MRVDAKSIKKIAIEDNNTLDFESKFISKFHCKYIVTLKYDIMIHYLDGDVGK